jgi:hypothetical protein
MLLHPSLAPARGFNHSQGNSAGGYLPRHYLPLYAHRVPAGFPSPAEEYAECTLDLNRYLVPDPAPPASLPCPMMPSTTAASAKVTCGPFTAACPPA